MRTVVALLVLLMSVLPSPAQSVIRRAANGARRLLTLTTVRAATPARYATYGDALRQCTERGYENDDIVRVVLEKTRRLRDELQQRSLRGVTLSTPSEISLGTLVLTIRAPGLRVLDFGGACGAHYFLARAMLPVSRRLRWVVVETPAMAKAATVLANDELSFSSSVTDAAAHLKPVDLLHTSGTLQCVDTPEVWLRTLVTVGAPHMLFNRLGLTTGDHEVITIHESKLSWNGPGALPPGFADRTVRYPSVFLREASFLGVLGEHYDVVATFADTSGTFAVGDEPIVGMGLFARHKGFGVA